ncbi:cobalt-precorrin-5B (C1)-methyltransferase [Methanosarcina thermophila]|jgi:cobalt-precorrin-5B (C1)-methyltransferase|uniref:Cobalt-precorrin-5B C(1)-methyltransferase n=3 Tax=Methanosarcina thermophila TaxID=2210 RepID=A0A1I7B070_METTE|nr:cobalt-precorrin-5B (C(1))-methyltransferase [Methanosarcina thermophila]ALK05072.1 MAG: cobalt-precorrin-6A synthase [Methanosarcina sp. 795]AKB13815.1 Cobalt-precorrin-6 synthase, anaerobic [Methanosarcina thermophila TM-1]AKB15545.1 Cobalt-precorrin-6 synthase, anaerobic [Methanosarcina thermophila CHTI-55]NLU57888.1 cobalt-precorrin-5B (C(1))-methyltransferase [Methanosarcina thermophila]SFT80573.1 cobalt-precorrin-5B (C1)-methyltransferase [Methanosarcina thermophila]
MIDPVNNFKIPEEWILRAGIPREELEKKVASGMVVVLSDGSVLKRGYTTGTTASAAAKAAVLSLRKTVDSVSVPTPIGLRAKLEVSEASQGRAVVKKIQNDHESDITRGLEFVGEARESEGIRILGGKGIGIVRRDGLQVPKGQPAINPKPMEQIKAAVKEAVDELGLKGAEVIISIPDGEKIGKETLNSRIGVEGGISILGSTGFVEPWNDHLGEMKGDLIRCTDKVVLTTGRVGMRYSHMLFPDYTVVMVGSRISEGLEYASGDVIICGLPGLALKWGNPDMLEGSGYATVVEMLEKEPEHPRLKEAFEMAIEKGKGARIVVIDRDGSVLMDSKRES